jgi:hypothetical protein
MVSPLSFVTLLIYDRYDAYENHRQCSGLKRVKVARMSVL